MRECNQAFSGSLIPPVVMMYVASRSGQSASGRSALRKRSFGSKGWVENGKDSGNQNSPITQTIPNIENVHECLEKVGVVLKDVNVPIEKQFFTHQENPQS